MKTTKFISTSRSADRGSVRSMESSSESDSESETESVKLTLNHSEIDNSETAGLLDEGPGRDRDDAGGDNGI